MKQGLSLKVSQHLALTPQLQQSIRLLQLSTLELNQEVEQLLSDNPFLEREADEAPREEFGLAQVPDYARGTDTATENTNESPTAQARSGRALSMSSRRSTPDTASPARRGTTPFATRACAFPP